MRPAISNVESDYMNRPTFTYNYPCRPSWKINGEGRRLIKISRCRNGDLDIEAEEIPEGLRGAKKVFITIPAEHANKLRSIL